MVGETRTRGVVGDEGGFIRVLRSKMCIGNSFEAEAKKLEYLDWLPSSIW